MYTDGMLTCASGALIMYLSNNERNSKSSPTNTTLLLNTRHPGCMAHLLVFHMYTVLLL